MYQDEVLHSQGGDIRNFRQNQVIASAVLEKMVSFETVPC